MTDIVTSEKRSQMMAAIASKDTRPEIQVRRALFASGYRYRLHRKDLPGTPDIVLPGKRIAIFVNGCFWHGHTGCSLGKVPSTRTDFWKKKFESNRERDKAATEALIAVGWRVLVIWECFTRSCKTQDALMQPLMEWLQSSSPVGELRSGRP